MSEIAIENLEVSLLIDALYEQYGYDFRHYSRASFKRRVQYHLSKQKLPHISALIPLVLYNETAFHALLFDLSVTVTEMFRDPWFYLALRQKVIPFLKTYPFINVWHAGCSTGEEVYSLAIVLHEEGLLERTYIYATDLNSRALQVAQARIYPLELMQMYSRNYQQAGGQHSLADYYHADYGSVIFDSALQKNITFAQHNLATDATFREMHLILCRNVFIYFTQTLQDRVLNLFRDSLVYNGFLCLGSKETADFSEARVDFEPFLIDEKIYQCKKKSNKPS